jgi:hypothetical protein
MLEFDINKTIEVLERTPEVLEKMLSGLSYEWLMQNEGPDTWSPFYVIGHLIHGEKTDWVPRMKIILSNAPDKRFVPFDRLGYANDDKKKPIEELLKEFKELRRTNLDILKAEKLTSANLGKTGIHPEFGKVTLAQLLATWATHDLGHTVQIARVMAKQYKDAVGPWAAYLSVMNK